MTSVRFCDDPMLQNPFASRLLSQPHNHPTFHVDLNFPLLFHLIKYRINWPCRCARGG